MNIIEIPSDHKMFSKEFSGEIDNFIYDEFGILITKNGVMSIGVCVLFEKEIEGTEIQLVILDNNPIDNVCYTIKFNENSIDGLDVICDTYEKKFLDIGHDLAQLVLRVICYIMSEPRKREIRPKTLRENKENIDKPEKTKDNRENKIFLLDDIAEYVSENGLNTNSSTSYKINCPCWNVRGHYRHYKSGKVVFVENYKKGKYRDKIEPKCKTYTI